MTRTFEDPVRELELEFRRGARTVEIVWRYPHERGRRFVDLRPEPNETGALRMDWITYEPPARRPVEAPFVIWDVKPKPAEGRKVVGLVSVAPGGSIYKVGRITAGGIDVPRAVEPATADELELVACLTDRLEDGSSLLSDLSEAGLVIRIEVDRLSTPLGSLMLTAGGGWRWLEEEVDDR